MDSPLSYQLADGVATISFDDGKANVMNMRMLTALNDALDQAEAAKAIVVLQGRPGVFSGGFDLKVLLNNPSEALQMLIAGARLSERLLACPRPLVAACTGHAIAMGAFILLCADVRVGVDQGARLHVNEVQNGMTLPHFAIEVCRQRLSPAAFTQAAMTAAPHTPAQALAAGFLDEIVPAEGLAAAVQAQVARLKQLDRKAFTATKLRARANTLTALRAAIDQDIGDWTALMRPSA
jgi:enoyl-CoA hydratase